MKFLVILTTLLFAVVVSGADDDKPAPAPLTTEQTPPTTNPPPKPDPPKPDPPKPVDPKVYPPAGHYNLTTRDGKIACLDAKFALQFVIETVRKVNDTKNETITEYISIRDAVVEGDNGQKIFCPDDLNTTTSLTLSLKFNNTNRLGLTFIRTDPGSNNETHYLSEISLKYPGLPGFDTVVNHHPLFIVNGTHRSYQCNSKTSVVEADPKNNRTITIIFSEVVIDAFRADKDAKNSVQVCPLDEDVSDMIPIAVGAALLALVAIVLVAYFIGRRRSRRLAYQSV